MKLEGKVTLITGAGRGIGEGIAISLAKEGADIAAADIDQSIAQKTAETIKKIGQRAIAFKMDVTQWDQVQTTVEQTIKELGRINILVNNAGLVGIESVENLQEEVWDRLMAVNVKGTFLCCKAVIPHMKQRGGGRIINLSSIAGKNGYAQMAHYCASKFAIVGFTNALAKELARDNITVNAICPGIVRTHMWDVINNFRKEPGETAEEFFRRHVGSFIPQGRPQTPEDMGGLAVYLATAENVTGQAINVDGGTELH